ncbi:MAG: hypothetical protein JKX74_08715 [Flavobacteriales bacterium]|nr:hypothetical protein [Flavobacteriales bacterium]
MSDLRSSILSLWVFAIFLIASHPLAAQKIDVGNLKGMKMRSIGPAGMSGRVTSIDVVESNPDIIYVGTASGGVWKSESGGIRWAPIFDREVVLSIGAVAVDQSNPDVVWVGTGEGNPRNSHSSGAGIYKSLDGGKNWKLMGLEKTKTIHRIIIHRDNPNIVYVAALGSAWGPNAERGVYKTDDGGKTWKKSLYVNDQTGAADLVVDPANPNKLVVAMWGYGRKPWFFNSGGKGSGLYITFDGGDTWKQRTEKDGLPKGELGRMGLAIAASNPKVIYALIEAKKLTLYKSTDAGFKWEKVSDKNVGNRPFYYADIYVDPNNENTIYNLWSYTSRSIDGGKTFNTILNYRKGVHPDHHAFWIDPNNSDYLIDGNDGGLNISRDGGANWRFVENLPLGQFYHINIDNDLPYNVYGGMQDNGSWQGPSRILQSGGIRNSHWQELLFGDGFDVAPNPSDSRYGYAMYQGGNLHKYDRETGRSQYIQPVSTDSSLRLRFNWNAGLAQDPFDDCTIYFGSQFLHRSNNCGDAWTVISPDLTTNDSAKQRQAESGGLTIDATQAENFTSIVSIAPSSVKQGVIWVGTDDGNLQLTRDGGKTWENKISRIKGAPAGAWIPFIEASPVNEGEAYVVINNYRQNDWKPYVYKTTDFGNTWVNIVSSAKVNGYALSIVQDKIAPDLLFLGTEQGLYFSIDRGVNWNKWGKDYPSVSTMDLKIHPRDGDLIIGTFGRAAYILDDITPLRELANEGASLLNKPFHVFQAPNAMLTSSKSIQGVRFTADAHYRGQNRSSAAMISFYLKDIEKKKEEKDDKKDEDKEEDKKDKTPAEKKKDKYKGKVKVDVMDSTGDTIRTYTMKPDTGLNRTYWGMNRNRIRLPQHGAVKENADMPGGSKVLPGKYKIALTYGDYSGSTSIEIAKDIREDVDEAGLKARAAAQQALMDQAELATKTFNRLKEITKIVSTINKHIENLEVDSVKKDIKKSGGEITKKVAKLKNLYMQPEDFVGYDHVTVRLMNILWTAADYIRSCKGAPTKTATDYAAYAVVELHKVVDKVNKFIAEDWAEYQKKVEAIEVSLFKTYEPIELKK